MQPKQKMVEERVVLNISGSIYETKVGTLNRFPDTLLGDHKKRILYYCQKTKQYYFERSRLFFDAILFFYQSNGILQCPNQIPIDLFEEECRFFQMPEDAIERLLCNNDRAPLFNEQQIITDEKHSLKGKIWDVISNPETSTAARNFAFFSLLMIVASITTTCLETIPSLTVDNNTLFGNPFSLVELILNMWFLFLLVITFLCTPSKKEFFTDILTWLDIIALFPYIYSLASLKDGIDSSSRFLRVARMVRIARLLHLSKQSVRIKVVIQVIKSSATELHALLMCVLIMVIFGGALMYTIESNSQFTDIPVGMYWGIQTISTVGFGDIHPVTILGKMFGAVFMVFGAMFITVPVLTMITKFLAAYEENDLSVRLG